MVLVHAQTSTENYIQSTTCLDADCVKKTVTVQYFDLLGRPKQIVNVKATPSEKDLVTPIVYDDLGRQTRTYLPVPQNSTANGAVYSQTSDMAAYPVQDITNFYAGEKVYTEKSFEKSPLERVLQQKQVGNSWDTKPVTFGYDVNNSSDHVKRYDVTTTWNPTDKLYNNQLHPETEYGTGKLIKNTVTDEDGNKVIEFKDGSGQTILLRKVIDDNHGADTYYVYNEYKQLVYVIPPLASASILNGTVLDNLCYQYKYDSKSRLAEKKLPGKDWDFMVYDKQDRLVLSQDGLLRTINNNFAAKGWLFSKYDEFGRIVYSGFFANTSSRIAMQTAINNMVANSGNNEKRDNANPIVQNGENIYYSKNAFPTGSMTILTVNYYDTYPSLPTGAEIPNSIINQEVLKQPGQNITPKSTRTLPLASYIKNIDDNNWTKNFSYYDEKGRVIGTYSINHLGGYTRTESELDFTGMVKNSNIYHLRKQGEAGIAIKERFIYDSQNRLRQHYHRVDNKPEELLAENFYDELSQLKNKKVGNNLQSIDYSYNIRGWMTGINKDQMAMPDLGGKLFSYKIKYNEKEGIDNPDSVLFPGKNVVPRYNGNIAEIDWRTKEENASLTPKRYGYAYDKLNRLTAGYYQNPDNPNNKENTESLLYDLNGNITNLYRTSIPEFGNTTATVIDKLEYIYDGKNQVSKINDISQNPSGYEGGGNTITYDINGNMKSMVDKNIKAITYNFLNLPKKIEYGGGTISIDYLYNAAGTKLQKKYPRTECGIMNCTTFMDVTDYLDGFQYLSSISSGNGGGGDPVEMLSFSEKSSRAMEMQAFSRESKTVPQAIKTQDLQFFTTSEGFYDYTKDQYIYQYLDHLGNVRVSYGRNSAGVLEITDKNDYYPFGMNHFGTGSAMFGQGTYKNHKYNGKELQETGMYDYGARMYMADIGRWGVMDAMSEKSRRWSPYHYAYNNPIRFIDPDGNFAVTYSGEAAQQAFTAYKASMSISAETGNSNSFTGFNFESPFVGGGSSPTFQFPKGTEEYYKKNFPAFYDLVKNKLPNMIKDEKFMSALSTASGFSIDELKEIFTYGKGMELKVMDLSFGDAEYLHGGLTEGSTLNTAAIQTALANWFEKANKDTNSIEGLSNLLYTSAVIAHETAHWGDDLGKRKSNYEDIANFMLKNQGFRPTDVGNFFEYKAFGRGEQGIGIGHYNTEVSGNIINYVKANFKLLQSIFKTK
ncbi:hypothetical protein B0E34_05635 [Chryseobacterium mucoviscidosis]|uniref:DUF6443 domain-containing protein n=2 Tax=Chryseobacterium mucoviscidosis TaxID=1945581 RepID=A0A202C6H2_9FLAO|nr:hypothetical protein B0E34_05635 [Chryseobacterium mucoviscidosis]